MVFICFPFFSSFHTLLFLIITSFTSFPISHTSSNYFSSHTLEICPHGSEFEIGGRLRFTPLKLTPLHVLVLSLTKVSYAEAMVITQTSSPFLYNFVKKIFFYCKKDNMTKIFYFEIIC